MLKLCGFAASNYYNKVKLALLEKEIAFEEMLVWTDRAPELMEKSPMGKIPYLETAQGTICESSVMLEYIEATFPHKPLLPADPFAAAKVRELIVFMELHLELAARELFSQAFFGGTVSEEVKQRAYKLLKRGATAFAKLARFDPYVAGAEFTLADCAAAVHLPIVSLTSKVMYDEDVLADLPIQDYMKLMNQRATMQRVNADRKVNTELMMARAK
jgi:glutathione S-transferase